MGTDTEVPEEYMIREMPPPLTRLERLMLLFVRSRYVTDSGTTVRYKKLGGVTYILGLTDPS